MTQSDGGRPGSIDRAAGDPGSAGVPGDDRGSVEVDGAVWRGAPVVRQPGYDVVSNLHGLRELQRLLERLGYQASTSGWSHPDGRTAVFLGGLVDRHGHERPCAPLVRELVDAGAALMTLGVEEYLELERVAERVLTARHEPVLVHAGAASPDRTPACGVDTDARIDGLIEERRAATARWLRTVPLWLDLPGLRVVHGCWSSRDVEALRRVLGSNDLADDTAFVFTMNSDATRRAIRTLLAGATVPLPEHLWCLDARGDLVRTARVRWWSRGPLTYRDRVVLPGGCTDLSGSAPAALDDSTIDHDVPHGSADVPVVIARSSCAAGPVALSPTVLCLGVAGRGTAGPLAYRWSGEPSLDASRIVHG